MGNSAAVGLVLVPAVLGANLPFVNERLFVVGPRRAPKTLPWRLLELLLLCAATVAAGFMFLTFAFPGLVWRYMRRRG